MEGCKYNTIFIEGQAAFRVKRVKLIYVVVYSKENLIRFATMIYSLYKIFNHKIYSKQKFIISDRL